MDKLHLKTIEDNIINSHGFEPITKVKAIALFEKIKHFTCFSTQQRTHYKTNTVDIIFQDDETKELLYLTQKYTKFYTHPTNNIILAMFNNGVVVEYKY